MNNTNSNPSASLDVANTIHAQIGGHRAFMMMGAKNVLGDINGLQFKIGRNSKGVTHITVTLDPSDTYTVEFLKMGRAPKFTRTVLGSFSLVGDDSLRSLIEENTGMYLSLGTMGR